MTVAMAIAAGLGALWLRSSLPPLNAEVEAAVTAPVTVYRDGHWIPHIFAAAPADAAFALGYLHAQDRLWQMEVMRRLGAGRLSEAFGAATLETDRFIRALGFASLAQEQYDRSPPAVREILDAYAGGVNRWLSGPRALPSEFIALRIAPEPWRPADSLIWLRTMALRLAGNRSEEILRDRLARTLPPELIADLWPPAPADAPVTIPDPGPEPEPEPGAGERTEAPAELGGASNIWVVGGTRTKSGKPLLANDPHLGLSAPISWYLARVQTPSETLAGATAPGFPFFIFGHNERIAWGLTNTGSDVEDLFRERLDPANPDRYLTPEGSEPFALRTETIKVKGGADVVAEVRSTRHGPVIHDGRAGAAQPDDEAEILALAAVYLATDDETPQAALGVNGAHSWAEFTAALAHQKIIQQNFGYADVDGNIGFIAPGRVPVRAAGYALVPAPGWSGEADWRGELPFAELPRVYNPPSDLIVNANNRIVGPGYRWYLGDGWDAGFRARRIVELLANGGPWTVASMQQIQADTVSLMARKLLPTMLAAMPAQTGHGDVLDALHGWSGEMATDRAEPLIFTAWLRAFNQAVAQERLGDAFVYYWGLRPLFIERVLSERPVWCGSPAIPEAADCGVRLVSSLDAAMNELKRRHGGDWRAWRWGEAHEARFDHAVLGRVPLLGRLVNIRAPIAGGNDTIMRAASDIADAEAPYAAIHGAGFRAVYDLADLARSQFIIAPGQSGNPLSIHYRDLFEIWRRGLGVSLGQSRAQLEDEASGRLVLRP